MSKKMLMVSTVSSTIDRFNRKNIKLLRDMGVEVSVACNFLEGNVTSEERVLEFQRELDEMGISWKQIDFSRSALNLKNHSRSYRQMKELLSDEKFDFIHCHTPIAAAITRMAAKKTKTPVIYTAHGFHFYHGAPLKNWLIFYPVEKLLAKDTDCLITINTEDHALALKKLRAKRIEYVPGVGIDTAKFQFDPEIRKNKRAELRVGEMEKMLLSVGELNSNKNHEIVIRALTDIKEPFQYFICGRGELEEKLTALIRESGLEQKVHLLGFREDVKDLLSAADAFVFPSFREGLSVSVMEAMSCGVPVIASRIRGNVDLIREGENGELFSPFDRKELEQKLERLFQSELSRTSAESYNSRNIETYSVRTVMEQMKMIYGQFI